jgi:5-methylthioadenosine/S-adenosylhomocysteine deaminase
LRWDDEIGSLAAGKKADLILLRRDELDVLPAYDALHTASSNAGGAQVRDVIVDGQIVVREGRLTTIDEDQLKARVRERAPKIVERFLRRVS